ncbi:MAG: glycosyltransferase family 2 protein, partial [Microlunatus sp.]|nr:glycosyltransferase family 2 protein [Microlunatus sp.]
GGRRARFGPRAWQAAAAGALIGANVPVRLIGVLVVIPFGLYLILAGADWRNGAWRRQMIIRLGAGIAGFAVLFGGYVGAYRVLSGHWGLSGADSSLLYSRAATVADCPKLHLNKWVAQECPHIPRAKRPGVDQYAHGHLDRNVVVPPGSSKKSLRFQFGLRVLQTQPLDMVEAAAKDFAKGFAWTRTQSPHDVPLNRWQFQLHYRRWSGDPTRAITQEFDHTDPRVIKPLARFLRSYQLHGGYTPGTLLGVAGLVGIAGMFRRDGRLRAESMLTVGIGLVLVGGAAGFEFSWRYQLPGLVFFPLAGAIGLTALGGGRVRSREATPEGSFGTRGEAADDDHETVAGG